MASARNKVISGDYFNEPIINDTFPRIGSLTRISGVTVENYDIMNEDKMKSASSTLLRAGAGALVLGPIGLLAGISGKRKGIYLIAIYFKDGKKSLIEVDDKIYKSIVSAMFV